MKPGLGCSPRRRSIIGLAEPEHFRYEDITEICESPNKNRKKNHRENEEEECAIRQVCKVDVQDVSLIPEANVPDLESPFAICASTKEQLQLFCIRFQSPARQRTKFFSVGF